MESIEKKIKKINDIEEKIITIEQFLQYALDHEPIKKLLDFLKINKLLNKELTSEYQFSFHDLTLLIDEKNLIEYVKKNNISKNNIEKILNDTFGEQDKQAITFFVNNIFNKISLLEKKKKLAENFNKEIEKLNLSLNDIAMENSKSMSKFIDEANKKEDKIKSEIDNQIKQQMKHLENRIAQKKKKN